MVDSLTSPALGPVDGYEPDKFPGQKPIKPPQPAADTTPVDTENLPPFINEEIELQINIGGQQWLAKSVEVERSFYEEIDTAKLTALPAPSVDTPIFEQRDETGTDPIRVTIDATSTADDGQPLQRIYTGVVGNTFNKGDGTWFVRCVNVMNTLINKTIDVSENNQLPLVDLIINQLTKESSIVENGFVIDKAAAKEDVPTGFRLISPVSEIDILATFEKDSITFAKALNELARLSNSVWWVDRFNRLRFGSVSGRVQLLEFITDSSAGKQTPPYRSVRVIGDGVVSKDGWGSSDLIGQSAILSDESISDTVESFQSFGELDLPDENDVERYVSSDDEELKEPTFVFKSRQIKTQKQANLTAAKIIDNLIEQTAGGHVQMVGNPAIGVHDKISLPERFGRGERPEYIVEKVTHNFNDSDGFITRVDVGGISVKHAAYYSLADQDVIKDVPSAQFLNANFEFN